MLGQIGKIDNKDDRKQIIVLLEKLTAKQRLAWLQWCLDKCPANISIPGTIRATPQGDLGRYDTQQFPWGSTEQVYFDFASAVTGFSVPMDACLKQLEIMVSKLGQRAALV